MFELNQPWRRTRFWKHWKIIVIALVVLTVSASLLLQFFAYQGVIPQGSVGPVLPLLIWPVMGVSWILERRASGRYRATIIQGIASGPNPAALEALQVARQNGWLEGDAFKGADLRGADLRNANLWYANLQDTKFGRAKLHAANFWYANLIDADLEGAGFDVQSTLPDGTNWAPGVDLTRFTDPKHPEFWRSDNPESPAYRGGKR
jgi:hypothetical protein